MSWCLKVRNNRGELVGIYGYMEKNYLWTNVTCTYYDIKFAYECYCLGQDYRGLPSLSFLFPSENEYILQPSDYTAPPRLNKITRQPQCKLAVNSSDLDIVFGQRFFTAFELYHNVDRQGATLYVGLEEYSF